MAVIQVCWQRTGLNINPWIHPPPTHKHIPTEWKDSPTHSRICPAEFVEADYRATRFFFLSLLKELLSSVRARARVCVQWFKFSVFNRCGQVQGSLLHPTSTLLFGETSVCVSHSQVHFFRVAHAHTHARAHTLQLSLSVVLCLLSRCAASRVLLLCGLTLEGVFARFTQCTNVTHKHTHTYTHPQALNALRRTFHQTFHRWNWRKPSCKVIHFLLCFMFICVRLMRSEKREVNRGKSGDRCLLSRGVPDEESASWACFSWNEISCRWNWHGESSETSQISNMSELEREYL